MGAAVAYIRVSTTGQNLSAQRTAVRAAGAEKIFEEKQSGADADRPRLKACLEFVREGDTLIVTKADRIARSSRHLFNLLHELTQKNVAVRFLDQPQLNTDDKYGRFMLTVLAGVAELERQLIRERQAAGIEDAKRRGIRFGRKPKINEKVAKVVKRLRNEGLSVPEIGRQLGLKRSSVYNALKLSEARRIAAS